MFNSRGALWCAALILLLMSGFNSKKRRDRGNPRIHQPITTNNGISLPISQGSGVTTRSSGNDANSKLWEQLNSVDSRGLPFAGMLQDGLNRNADRQTNLSNFLNYMSQAGDYTDERMDMLYQYFLQLIQTDDQRQYDWNMLQESRQYNNPLNELARFMGAGISRDAALQLMNGAAGGTSALGSVIGSGSNASAPSVSAPSGTMELQRSQNTQNIVFGAVNALTNLLQTGVGMAQGIEQVKSQQIANSFSQNQLESFNSVQQIASALQTMQSNGQIESSDIEKLSNANDLIKFLQEKAKDNEQIAQLIQSPQYNRALGSIFGRDYFNQYWQSIRDTRDSGTLFDQFIRQQELQNSLANINIEKIGAEMSLIGSQERLNDQKIIESCTQVLVGEAQIRVLDAQGRWTDIQADWLPRMNAAQIDVMESQSNLLDTQNYGQSISNNQALLNYEYNSAGFPMMKLARIHELENTLAYWQTQVIPSVRREKVQTWLQDVDNARDAAYIMSLRNAAVGDFAQSNPALWYLCNGFKAAGVDDMMKIGVNAAQVATPFVIGTK